MKIELPQIKFTLSHVMEKKMFNKIPSKLIIIAIIALSISQCKTKNIVVIYTSEDKVFSKPILTKFEQNTDIIVKAIYDTEETKSTGIINRLIAEKNNP